MGRRRFALLVTGLLLSLCAAGLAADPFIQDLVRTGKVSADVTYGVAATGDGWSQYAALGVFCNLTAKPLAAVIPRGLLLLAAPGHQDRIVGDDQVLSLAPGAWVEATLFNFCIESDQFISPGEHLTIAAITPNDALLKLLGLAIERGLTARDPDAVQRAIWNITDSVPADDDALARMLQSGQRAAHPSAAILMPVVAWGALIFAGIVVAAIYSIVRARRSADMPYPVERFGWSERRPPPGSV